MMHGIECMQRRDRQQVRTAAGIEHIGMRAIRLTDPGDA
jgi:hypothetical protein